MFKCKVLLDAGQNCIKLYTADDPSSNFDVQQPRRSLFASNQFIILFYCHSGLADHVILFFSMINQMHPMKNTFCPPNQLPTLLSKNGLHSQIVRLHINHVSLLFIYQNKGAEHLATFTFAIRKAASLKQNSEFFFPFALQNQVASVVEKVMLI